MKYFLLAALCCCLSGHCYAQWGTTPNHTATENLFNISKEYVYNRHEVYLENNEWMTIELADVTDYLMLKNMDSIMNHLWQDIAIYRDSTTALQNVRVDYALQLEVDDVMMRFRKYDPDGEILVKHNNEVSRMKVEKDTIRLIIRKQQIEHNSHMHFYDFPVQVTFLLNNYANLGNILKDKGRLNNIINSLAAATLPALYSPNISDHRTTAFYYPYRANAKVTVHHIDNPFNEETSRKTGNK